MSSGEGFGSFVVVPDRSALVIDARSNVGPITFVALGIEGTITVGTQGGELDINAAADARLTLEISRLTSGNGLYDAELQRRIDARRYPEAVVEMRDIRLLGPTSYAVTGEVTLHGVTRQIDGAVSATVENEEKIIVDGEQSFDIREYGISAPAVLMLRIFPDVRVRLHLEAERAR